MDSFGVPAPKMDWESANLPEAWRRFKQHAELIFSGPLREKREQDKCSYLLLWIGEKGRDIFNTWTLTDEDATKLQTYYDKYTAYLTPKSNPIYARYRFHEKTQGDGETFEHFVTELKLLVKDCGYPNSDEMVRDRIVFATNSPRVREKLLSHGAELTLDQAIDIARSHEIAQVQLKEMVGSKYPNNDAVHAIARRPEHRSARTSHKARPREPATAQRECDRCGGLHTTKDGACPAKGKQCMKCKKFNHFAKACKSKLHTNNHTRKVIHTMDEDTEDEQVELFIDGLTSENTGKCNEQAYAEIEIGTQKVKFKIDTGAQTNAIPVQIFERLFRDTAIKPTTQKISGYGGEFLKVKGTCHLKCKYKNTSIVLEFYIVDTKAPPILGMRASLDLKLIKLILTVAEEEAKPCTDTDSLLKEYTDVFQGIGEFPGECNLHVDPHATPVVYPPRRVPIALRDRLKKELDKMEESNVICKVTEPTEWVNALVVVEKPQTGKLRVCLDPRDLNKAIKRPHYPLPTLEDVTTKLAGAKYFSVLDARSGYWAIKLSTTSSLLTTFNTPFGRYRFLRLPFGINSAQDEFQRRVDETYEGLTGVAAIVDDILVFGKTKLEHDNNLRAMLKRTRERGVRLNPDKCQICVSEVSYFGHTLSREGVKPDPAKVKAIQDMQPPTSRGELETILGMVNYLARFAPRLSEINAPLRQLLKQDSEFLWDKNHDKAFTQTKKLITDHPVLAYFDPQKELRLQVDASKCGLGAVMLQDEKPIAYASKSLNSTEVNYAQIEKELYAVLFGCKRFHEYMYGRRVIVESDHKPLEAILRKPLAAAPPRLQRMILQLQKYNIHIIHRPGKDIPVADTLSRKSIEHQDSSLMESMEAQVHTLISTVPVSDRKLLEIKDATAQDAQLTALRRATQNGWPNERRKCPPSIQEYWNHRDEISEMEGILFKGEKIIVPLSLRGDMIQRVHAGHMGMEKSKHRARDLLFWPGMGKQIEATVEQCSICQERRDANPKEPLWSHDIPERPWQVVGTDLFTWNTQNLIVIVDYYSRFFEMEQLTNTTSLAVIAKLKSVFARHGIAETVISDNGPCYSSEEFRRFANAWDFTHTTTSPRYPQSNGLAEKTVQTAKRILDKAKAGNTDPYLALLEYRNTPVDNLQSPAQLLMSRRLRSILPATSRHLKPQVASQRAVQNRRKACQHRQQAYFNRGTRPLPHLPAGTPIRFRQEDGSWRPATVTQHAHTHRSYHIQTEDGQTLRRNRWHLRDSRDAQDTKDTQHADTHTNNTQPPHPEPADHPQPTNQQKPNYTTRFGRISRPRQILDL